MKILEKQQKVKSFFGQINAYEIIYKYLHEIQNKIKWLAVYIVLHWHRTPGLWLTFYTYPPTSEKLAKHKEWISPMG